MSSKYLNRQDIIVDSDYIINGTPGDFTMDLKLKNRDVDTVVVKRLAIKKGWYTIPKDQNTFVLIEGIKSVTVTIPYGNWNVDSFRTYVKNLLNTVSPNTWTYDITFPNAYKEANTGLYTFTCLQGNPVFVFTSWVYEQFGFDANSSNVFVNNKLLSKNIVYFQSKDFVRIHCNFIQNNNTISKNILQEVQAAGPDFATMQYECTDIEANSLPFENTSDVVQFTTKDEHGNTLTPRHVLMNLCVYKKNTISDTTNGLVLADLIRKTLFPDKK